MKNAFHSKGFGRIYVSKTEDIAKVKEIIKKMDEYEYGYLPNNLIIVFGGVLENVYNGKFDDLDLDELMVRCWSQGIYAFYTMSTREYF